MSTKHVRTAFDLVRFNLGLSVKCQTCGHTLTLEGYDVVSAIETLPLKELEPRLRCSECGAKDVQIVILHPPAKR
jgi:hypothetical protein